MATNPMQRKARNSFLLGMLLMLLIASLVIALLFMKLKEYSEKEKAELQALVKAYVLNQDVSSGQVITPDMFELQNVNRNLVPSNATSDPSVIENYALQDKEGNNIYTKYNKNNEAQLYIEKDNKEYEVKQEQETENYYIDKDGEKEYIELNSVPLIAKVTMKKNTLITTELIAKGNNTLQNDVRKQEYNMIVMPMDLMTGDYVDIRLMLPTGQDYIVISKKEIEVPNIGGVDSTDTIWVNLSEDEILHMSCAIIDAYRINGSKLYMTKYTEAGMQEAATPTYPASKEITALLQSDPNILEKAMNEIRNRYNNTNAADLRNNYINSLINDQGDQSQSKVESNMSQSITNSKNSRKEYLDSLSAGPVQ